MMIIVDVDVEEDRREGDIVVVKTEEKWKDCDGDEDKVERVCEESSRQVIEDEPHYGNANMCGCIRTSQLSWADSVQMRSSRVRNVDNSSVRRLLREMKIAR